MQILAANLENPHQSRQSRKCAKDCENSQTILKAKVTTNTKTTRQENKTKTDHIKLSLIQEERQPTTHRLGA